MLLLALVILVPSCLGFANKFFEFIALYRGDVEGVFAITPIVNYLRRVGWRPGLSWGQEVPPGTGVGKDMRIVRPAGPNGPAFATSENFRVILRWNQSDFFGLAVGLLSDRIAAT